MSVQVCNPSGETPRSQEVLSGVQAVYLQGASRKAPVFNEGSQSDTPPERSAGPLHSRASVQFSTGEASGLFQNH